MSLHSFSDWLASTPLSLAIQNTSWVIPTVQSVHILAIAASVSSVLLLDLRVFGVFARGMPLAAVAQRFVPWVWWSLLVLLVSGTILIIGEPGRSLTNPAFQAKIVMIIAVIILTLLLARPLRANEAHWEQSQGRRFAALAIATVSLILWSLIVFASRWIAYVSSL
ncbi:MAG TPA: DUF6644 family protein [Steroidobacteraceae bacterium]